MTTEINTMIQELDRIDALCNKKDDLQASLWLVGNDKSSKDEEALNEKEEKAKDFQTQRSTKLQQLNHGINLEGDNAPVAVKTWEESIVGFDKSVGTGMWVPINYKKFSLLYVLSLVISWLGFLSLITFIVTSLFGLFWLQFVVIPLGIGCLFLSNFVGKVRSVAEDVKIRNESKAVYDEKVKEFDEATKNYFSEFCKKDHSTVIETLIASAEKYDKDFLDMVADCEAALEKFDEEYRSKLEENQKNYEVQAAAIKADIAENEKELSAVTLIHPDLFRKAAKISAVLKMYRAESLSGAINIVFEDERREAEEAERRAEAERREQLLEQQIRENRLAAEEAAREMRQHNEAMEKQAQEAQRKADLQRERDNQAAENLLKQRKKAASDRCYHCANSSCSLRVRSSFYNTGDVCPNYRPK